MKKQQSDHWLVFLLVVMVGAMLSVPLLWEKPVPADRSSPDLRKAATTNSQVFSAPKIKTVAPLVTGQSSVLDAALQQQDPIKRSLDFDRLLSEWFERDPETALAYIRHMPASADYTQGLLIVLQKLGRSDPERAIALAGEMAKSHEDRVVYSALFDQIAGLDIDRAMRALELVPSGESKDYALRALAAKWSDANMNASLDWAQHLTDAGERSAAMETALLTLSKQDFRRSFDLAQEFLTGEALDRIISITVKQLIGEDPGAASELVSQMPASPAQAHAAFTVARALAAEESETAATWTKTLAAGETQQLALNNVLDVWSRTDPTAAGNYVAQMPAGAEQDFAVTHLAQLMAARNPDTAIQWANGLENDSARNAAVVSIASGWAMTDPAAATQWAQTLAVNSPGRIDAIKSALSYWVISDTHAARSFAQTLPTAEQQYALQSIMPP
jgi:hypothetical protein